VYPPPVSTHDRAPTLTISVGLVLMLTVSLVACDKEKTSKEAPKPDAVEAKVVASVAPGASQPEPRANVDSPAVDAAPVGTQPAEAPDLDRFIPQELRGLKRNGPPATMGVTEGSLIAHGAYLIEEERRFVNVNFTEVVDLEFEKAQFRVGKGESKEDGAIAGQEIDGRLVQRTSYGSPAKSEATVLLADRIVVRVSVEKAKDPDEAIAYLKALDLSGLEGLVH
jgi:hypothetical protein